MAMGILADWDKYEKESVKNKLLYENAKIYVNKIIKDLNKEKKKAKLTDTAL